MYLVELINGNTYEISENDFESLQRLIQRDAKIIELDLSQRLRTIDRARDAWQIVSEPPIKSTLVLSNVVRFYQENE